jgi:DNA-directed RNA polymerase III subunit RPC6
MYCRRFETDKASRLLHLPDSAYNIIYGHIAGMGRQGCWRKSIEKTNLHINTITKGLKELLSAGLIKEFKTAKNPTKRMYILSELEPTEESSGGNFYNDGELDEALVSIVGLVALNYVENESWVVLKEKSKPKESPKDQKAKKHKPLAAEEQRKLPLTIDGPKFRGSYTSSGHILVPQPPSFTEYPTAQDILEHIESSGVVKDIRLNLSDIKQLIRTLILDDRLEEVSDGRYRTVRRAWKDKIRSSDPQSAPLIAPLDMDDDGIGPGVGLTEIPCGRCPVKQDCRIGGKINPDNCEYMAKWLAF